jgi:hypothetical protein
LNHILPSIAAFFELFTATFRKPIHNAFSTASDLTSSDQKALLLQFVQYWIDGPFTELQCTASALRNTLNDRITMLRPVKQNSQNRKLRDAIQKIGIRITSSHKIPLVIEFTLMAKNAGLLLP